MLMAGPLGITGFDLHRYLETPDSLIIELMTADRDKDGKIIPELTLARRRRANRDEATGRPEEARHEFQTREELEIPQEAFEYRPEGRVTSVNVSFVLLFWQLWRGRGLTSEQTLVKWREYMASYGCKRS